jgi:hypothetical protein
LGRGVAGKANTPFVPTVLLLAAALLPPAALLEVALFSAVAAALAVSSPVPVLFCCAHNGKANSALITNPAHQLRIAILLSFIHRIPFDFTRPPAGRSLLLADSVRCIAAFPSIAFSLQAPTTPPHFSPDTGRNLHYQKDAAQ